MAVIFVVFVISAVLSLVAVALILRLSHKKGWYDQINDRKIHTGDIPRLGGIGFALAFIITAAFINFAIGRVNSGIRFLPCLTALLLILIFGVFDDFRPIAPRYKLLIQIIAALCVIIPGYVFRRITYIEAGILSDLEWLGIPITLLWIVGLTNAMNLIDGIDGLAGGLSALIALFFGLIFFFCTQNSQAVLFCISLSGVMLGFLVFNAPFPNAKIFMGDGGSQFLGFSLALLPLIEEYDSRASLPIPYATALLAIPIFDTIAAVWRRIRDHRRIDSPDTSHIHHKLMNLGLSVRGVNAVLYGLQIIIGVLTFISIYLHGLPSLYFLCAAYLAVLVFFTVIHFLNRAAIPANKGVLNSLPPE